MHTYIQLEAAFLKARGGSYEVCLGESTASAATPTPNEMLYFRTTKQFAYFGNIKTQYAVNLEIGTAFLQQNSAVDGETPLQRVPIHRAHAVSHLHDDSEGA
jgi:hypothetical protein